MLSPANVEDAAVRELVTVGYHRPTLMSWPRVYCLRDRVEERRVREPDGGRDVAADDQRPAVGELDVAGAEEVPAVGNGVKVPVGGSKSRSEFSAAPKPSSAKTWPVGSRDMCTATIGQVDGALQSPMVAFEVAASEPLSGTSATTSAAAPSASRDSNGIRRLRGRV